MSIAENLEKLKEIKEDFKDRFERYEVDISDETLFEEYPSLMDEINMFSGAIRTAVTENVSVSVDNASKTVINAALTAGLSVSYEKYEEETDE